MAIVSVYSNGTLGVHTDKIGVTVSKQSTPSPPSAATTPSPSIATSSTFYTAAPITYSPTQSTDDDDDADDDESYPRRSGVLGYWDDAQHILNNDVSQIQLLYICGGFTICLLILLCVCYVYQCKKTKRLTATLYSFNPELLQVLLLNTNLFEYAHKI